MKKRKKRKKEKEVIYSEMTHEMKTFYTRKYPLVKRREREDKIRHKNPYPLRARLPVLFFGAEGASLGLFLLREGQCSPHPSRL